MVLGREGPTVQMGGGIGRMVTDIFKEVKDDDTRHSLLASGAAGGLAAAFSAPLAGIMFVVEEMRPQFRCSTHFDQSRHYFRCISQYCVSFRSMAIRRYHNASIPAS